MPPRFTPCPACQRHVRAGECTCPFCGTQGVCASSTTGASRKGLSRAALLAAGAGALIAGADCGARTSLGDDAGTGDAGDAALDAGDAGDVVLGVVAAYGGPFR